MISDELATFLESGNAIYIATRDGGLSPNGTRVWAVVVDPDREHVTAYVRDVAAERILEDLREHAEVALAISRPSDDRSCQVKGVFLESRSADAEEREVIRRQAEGFKENLESIGFPRLMTSHWASWPSVALRIRVRELFSQTPGPGAGEPMT